MTKTILCIVGTRPAAIKMAPVILALRQEPWAKVVVVTTAQHRELADEVLRLIDISPDIDLDLMQPNQKLADLTARAITGLDGVIGMTSPDLVIAQGDTTSVMAAAMACFYRQVPFLHVEAGLRSFDMQNPFPEEFNRLVASRIAHLHFAPTESARQHLLNEGVEAGDILVTGNTVIDALHMVAARDLALPIEIDESRRLVLVTVHRRENFGAPLQGICDALRTLVEEHPDVELLWPVHPNPNVTGIAHATLGAHPRIHLVKPQPYSAFVAAMKRAHLILSDSGGVQEEAPALARPVLVLRRETERPEAIAAGVVRLIGTDREAILHHARELLGNEEAYRDMARGGSPYGDGHASQRIVDAINIRFKIGTSPA